MTARAKCCKCTIYGPVNWTIVDGVNKFVCDDSELCKINRNSVMFELARRVMEACGKGTINPCHGTLTIKDGKMIVESSFFEGPAIEIIF